MCSAGIIRQHYNRLVGCEIRVLTNWIPFWSAGHQDWNYFTKHYGKYIKTARFSVDSTNRLHLSSVFIFHRLQNRVFSNQIKTRGSVAVSLALVSGSYTPSVRILPDKYFFLQPTAQTPRDHWYDRWAHRVVSVSELWNASGGFLTSRHDFNAQSGKNLLICSAKLHNTPN